MKNAVQNLMALAILLALFSQIIEFFAGYYERTPQNCETAILHPVLESSWYARGCNFAARDR